MRSTTTLAMTLAFMASSRLATAQEVIHLPSGDTVAILAVTQIRAPNRPPGLLIRFYPYTSLADTIHLRKLALSLRQTLRPKIEATGVPWLVLQATDQTPGPHLGIIRGENYGFVLEKRSNGKWYFLDGSEPIDDSH